MQNVVKERGETPAPASTRCCSLDSSFSESSSMVDAVQVVAKAQGSPPFLARDAIGGLQTESRLVGQTSSRLLPLRATSTRWASSVPKPREHSDCMRSRASVRSAPAVDQHKRLKYLSKTGTVKKRAEHETQAAASSNLGGGNIHASSTPACLSRLFSSPDLFHSASLAWNYKTSHQTSQASVDVKTKRSPRSRAQTAGASRSPRDTTSYTLPSKLPDLSPEPGSIASSLERLDDFSRQVYSSYVNKRVRSLMADRKKHCHRRRAKKHETEANPNLPPRKTVRMTAFDVKEEIADLVAEEFEIRQRRRNLAVRRFRLLGHIVLIMIRFLSVIVAISERVTIRTATELQWQTLYAESDEQSLAFNKSHYARERAIAKMPRWAVRLLEKSPTTRTEQDCRKIHALLRGLKAFDKFTEKIQMSMCRAFSYMCVQDGRVVLRRGHIGHNFYFIYSGSVFVNVEDVNSKGEVFIKTEAILSRGDSFGELALLQDIRRTATIAVRETCELLVVDKDVFSQVCPKIFQKELDEKTTFLSRVPLFSPRWWSKESVDNICLEAQIQDYKINRVISLDSIQDDWMYICMEGKCQVIRCLSLDVEDNGPPSRAPPSRRDSTTILSEELLELLDDRLKKPSRDVQEVEEVQVSTKEKLLGSLGLEYVAGKRHGHFIEEMHDNEVKRQLLSGYHALTLTSLISRQSEVGDKENVYLNIGVLQPEEVFDLYPILYKDVERTNSTLLLISCGARVMRIRKSCFFRHATPSALDYARNLARSDQYPSDAVLLQRYRGKSDWERYKCGLVREVLDLDKGAGVTRESRTRARSRTAAPAASGSEAVPVEGTSNAELWRKRYKVITALLKTAKDSAARRQEREEEEAIKAREQLFEGAPAPSKPTEEVRSLERGDSPRIDRSAMPRAFILRRRSSFGLSPSQNALDVTHIERRRAVKSRAEEATILEEDADELKPANLPGTRKVSIIG